MPIAQSGSASMPVALRVLLRPIRDMLGSQVIRPGENVQGERVMGFLNGDFKWDFVCVFCMGFLNGDFKTEF